jgi:hypothetical protein
MATAPAPALSDAPEAASRTADETESSRADAGKPSETAPPHADEARTEEGEPRDA